MAASALLSCATPRIALSKTTATMMITSANSPVCSTSVKTKLTAAATNKMMIIGSVSCFRNFTNNDVFFASASLFLPFASKRFFASALVNPSVVD